MFRHYRVILRDGHNLDNNLHEDETIVSKHVGVW